MNSIIHFILSALLGVAVFFALYSMYLSIRLKEKKIYFAIAAMSAGAALYTFCSIFLYAADSVDSYISAVSVQMFGTAAYHAGLMLFALAFTDRPWKYALLPVIMLCLILAGRLIDPYIIYSSVNGIARHTLPWGEQITVLNAGPGAAVFMYEAVLCYIYGSVIYSGWRSMRSGSGRGFRLILMGTVMLIIAVYDITVFNMRLPLPFLGETSLIALIAMAGFYISDEVMMKASLTEKVTHNQRELAEAQNTLLQRETYTRLLFTDSYIPIIVLDPVTGLYIDCNMAAVKIYGCGSRDEVIGRSPLAFSHTVQYDGRPSGAAVSEKITAALTYRNITFDWKHRRPDGSLWDGVVRLMLFTLGDRSLLQFSLEDVTQKRAIINALMDSEERFRITAEKTGIMFYDYNIITGKIIWSGAIEQITGYSTAEFPGAEITGWEQLIHPDDRDSAVSILEKAVENISVYNAEYRFRRRDGAYVYLDDYGVVLPGPDLVPARILGLMSDVSRRRQVELNLREALENLEKSQQISHVGNWSWDITADKFTASDEGLRLYGFPAGSSPTFEEVASRIHPDDRPEARRVLTEALAAGSAYSIYIRIHRANDGVLRYLHSMAEVSMGRDGKAERVFGINQDITDQRTAQIEKEKMHSQLLHAQKMEAVGTLASGLAHDFNNMLAGIMGSLSLIELLLEKNRSEQCDSIIEYIKTANHSAQRAADMIKHLLTISRKREMQAVTVNVNTSLKNILEICRNSFPKSITIDFRLPDEPVKTVADPVQLDQVFLNLCVNAWHAMTTMRTGGAEGGVLSVALSRVTNDAYFRQMTPEAGADGDYIKVTVSDTGVGISSECMERIFEPFYTTKGKDGGSGLGLSIVYGIVQQHGGFIAVYSEPGLGTTFTVHLPLITEAGSAPAADSEATRMPAGTGTILIVDDESAIIKVASGILTACGYNVLSRQRGEDAVALYREMRNEISAVLLDMSMPGMSGLDIFRELIVINPQVKVLLSSGFAEDERVTAARSSGVRGFIQKPYTASELSIAVWKILSS
jgi:PAS domain S-box-containing protein